MPSRSDGSSRHGMHSAPARRYSASSSAGADRAGQRDVDPGGRDLRAQGRRRPCRPGRRSARRRARRAAWSTAHASTSTSKPFLATSRPTPSTRRRPLRCAAAPLAAQQVREVRREAVVDEVDAGLGRDRLEVLDVGLRAGDDEARGVQLAPQPPLRVQLRRVDVARVAGERERQPGDAGRQPRDRRRAVREVRVQVADVRRERVGERDRLDQLLDVDLARAGEAGPAVPEGLARTRSGTRARRRAGGGACSA